MNWDIICVSSHVRADIWMIQPQPGHRAGGLQGCSTETPPAAPCALARPSGVPAGQHHRKPHTAPLYTSQAMQRAAHHHGAQHRAGCREGHTTPHHMFFSSSCTTTGSNTRTQHRGTASQAALRLRLPVSATILENGSEVRNGGVVINEATQSNRTRENFWEAQVM